MWSTGRTYTSTKYPEDESLRPKLGRSRSLGAADTLEMLESHRLHRQQYLLNRSKFERQLAPPNMPPPPVPQMKSSLYSTKLLNKKTSVFREDNYTGDMVVPTFNALETSKTTNPTVTYKQQMSFDETDALIFHQPKRESGMKYSQEIELSARSSIPSYVNFHLNFPTNPPITIPNNKTRSSFVRDFSRRSLQYQPTMETRISKWECSSKMVKDITDTYLVPKQGRPTINHNKNCRSLSSSIPVKLLAAKFSSKD